MYATKIPELSVPELLIRDFGMQSRYSGTLLSAPEDVELLTNVGDCCVQRAELAITLLQQSATSNMSQEEWAPVKAIYERGLQVQSIVYHKFLIIMFPIWSDIYSMPCCQWHPKTIFGLTTHELYNLRMEI